MTAIVLAADKSAVSGVFKVAGPICFTDLGRLRVQECERVVALRTELTKCGAKVVEAGDTLTVYPRHSTARRSKPTTTTAWPCVSRFSA